MQLVGFLVEWVSDEQSGLSIVLVNKGKGWLSDGDIVAVALASSVSCQGGPDLNRRRGSSARGSVWGTEGSLEGEIIDVVLVWSFDDSLGEETEVEDGCAVDENRAACNIESVGAQSGDCEKDSNKE